MASLSISIVAQVVNPRHGGISISTGVSSNCIVSSSGQCRPCKRQTGNGSRGNAGLWQWRQTREGGQWGESGQLNRSPQIATKAAAEFKETALMERQWGPPIQLGMAKLPQDLDLVKLRSLLYQWGSSLTQNANLPLPAPLKVDKVEGGLRLGFIKVTNGMVEDLVHIDVIVSPPSEDEPKAVCRALRNGQMKNSVPPGEAMIMQGLLVALKKSLPLCRP